MVPKGKTGNIHGVEVKARAHIQPSTVKVSTHAADDQKAVIEAAQRVYEQHHAVIQHSLSDDSMQTWLCSFMSSSSSGNRA